VIKGLHHNAYRCRDSEETRAFYEDFLGLRMVSAFEINEGRALHTFFEMDDGSCLAFFEVPGSPFDFKRQDSLDLHIALGVEPETFDAMLEKAKAEGREVRGPVDPLCPVDLFPRSQRLCHRIDRQHRQTRRDHGSGDLEAARGACALAGDEGPLTAPLRIAEAAASLPQSRCFAPNSRSKFTNRRRK
jgi:catechol 2,3-dioxygenase-like lactoylglutathione lyase family enzyme